MNATTEVAAAEKKAAVRDIGTINSGADSETLTEGGMAFAADVEGRCGSSGPETFAT
ncbi:hypothetical protein [Tunturiibacter gelidoferens]|uniref:Uncharacterized protein n=1 Tax=Tunturiibacter gelidiferens TaxID=3069689 RepID=A0A9X0QGC3_9BACT|nr:hypothetical protein [Edaphobacter lichenicola]MBB5329897.1 hypothetical protein [Edaphobacter lichenicola]